MITIVCTVWKHASKDGLCDTHEVEITEEEIVKMAIQRTKAEIGWTDADIYNAQTEHIKI